MTSTPTPPLTDLLSRRREGYSLEAPFYVSEDVLKADVEHIFSKHWIFVAVEPQIPEEGDYITVDIGSTSVLIVRDEDGEVRAFHNVCRHRGAKLCAQHQGATGNIVCPYHQWTYNLKGVLIHTDHMGEGFNHHGHGLKPVHARSLGGLIFICLAETPPADFEDMAREMTPYIAPHRLAECKVAASVDIIEEGNWKLTMENNRECYHCRGNHPELTLSLFEYGFGYQPNAQNAEGMKAFAELIQSSHARWVAMGLPSAEIERLDTRVTGFRTQRLPLQRSGESQTMNTEVACKKLLADFPERSLGGLSFWTQPNSWHHFMSDCVISFTVLPISAGKTLVRTTWCVHKDAIEGVDYTVENLTRVWNATNDQDRALVELSQQGVASSAYEPGPYSPYTESLVEKFCHWYIGRMREALSVAPVAPAASPVSGVPIAPIASTPSVEA